MSYKMSSARLSQLTRLGSIRAAERGKLVSCPLCSLIYVMTGGGETMWSIGIVQSVMPDFMRNAVEVSHVNFYVILFVVAAFLQLAPPLIITLTSFNL